MTNAVVAPDISESPLNRDLAKRRRMSIVQLGSRGIPGHRGGVERVVEAIAPRLAARGHRVVVYCADTPEPRPETYHGVELRYVRAPRGKHLDTIARSFLASLAEMFGPARIIHYHGSGSAPLAWLPRLAGKKVVVTVHGLDWQRRKWNIFGRWFLKLGEWAAVRLPHRTVVVGPDLKTELDRLYNTDTILIPNGVEDRPDRRAERILEMGLDARGYVLFLARLVPEKQCHTLIAAWMGLAENHGLKLVIAGPTWHSADYVDSLRSQAAGDPSVMFVGEVDEDVLEELYSNCLCYVLPSEVEGMSLSLLDAMAFGACVICSDIPANAYVVGEAGHLFPPLDVSALRLRLQQVIDEPAQTERLRVAARTRITNEFRWDRVADHWEALYADLEA